MSASTVSITASQGPATRRRAGGASDVNAAAAIVTELENRGTRLTAGDTAAAILMDARKSPAQTQARKYGAVRKSTKPRWLTALSILTKNLALIVVLLGFVQMVRWTVWNSGPDTGDLSIMSGDFQGKLSEMERFVEKTIKAMQVQVNAIDYKVEDKMSSVKKEFDEKLESKGAEIDLKLRALDVRSDAFEKFMDGFKSKNLLSKAGFREFFEDFKKSTEVGGGDGPEVSVDDIKEYARKIVLKEIERHAADGLGMADYALASAGARVVRHSARYRGKFGGLGFFGLLNRNKGGVEPERMLRPRFGEPGQCFPLEGRSGFVEIRLRAPIIPEAVTLEHVDKSVAFDRSSAPKQCRVSGWLHNAPQLGGEKMFLLTEFTYDLEKRNVQTYKVESAASNLVDTVRLDFTSNHGSDTHTCIYRLRVHGYEPSPVPALDL